MYGKKMNPFGKGESKAMEAKEKKMAPSKKAYAAMEKKMEPGMHKGKKSAPFKPCAGCPTPAKCSKMGMCAKMGKK